MRFRSRLGYAVGAAAGLALLAGCSGAGSIGPGVSAVQSSGGTGGAMSAGRRLAGRIPSVLPPALQRPARTGSPLAAFISPTLKRPAGPFLFVSDYYNSAVTICNYRGVIGRLTAFYGPQGLAIDAAGNLYVADTNNTRVQVYALPYNGSPTSLNDSAYYPTGVAVDSSGNVAVTNVYGVGGAFGSVTFYPPGATAPTNTLTDSTVFLEIFFGAFDSSGNLYIDGIGPNGTTPQVGVITGGINGTAITPLTTGNSILFPGAVQVTPSGQIAIDDQQADVIYTYNPPVNGALGMPVSTTPLGGSKDPVTFSFYNSAYAVTADAVNDNVSAYAYPAGGSPFKTLQFPRPGEQVGTAIYPTQTF